MKIPFQSVEIGRIELIRKITAAEHGLFNALLLPYELEIFSDRKTIITEKVKELIREMINDRNNDNKGRFSNYLSNGLHYDYTYLSVLFSEIEGHSIERFYINERIAKIKELMISEEMTVKEISYRLNYSSVSHLCMQFKKVTGQTPSEFKKLGSLINITV